MSTSRRDFIKTFGVGLAALLLTRCKWIETPTPIVTCYEAILPTDVLPPTPESLDARGRLRLCWLRFDELAQKTSAGANREGDAWENLLGQQMIADHRLTLDELVADEEISPSVTDLVQEAYEAAVYHIWRSNVPITCYEPMIVDYAPASAGVLVRQTEVLDEIASQGTLDPETLVKAHAALEHDLAYYALSEGDVQALYDRLIKDYQENNQPVPSFDALQLEITPEARAAAQFILELLAGK